MEDKICLFSIQIKKRLNSLWMILIGLHSWGAIADTQATPDVICGEWKINGGVKKLFDTPMGEVYKFTPSSYFDFNTNYNRKNESFNSIQFELFKNAKERKNIRRFIVIDFKIRVFPAMSKVENADLFFAFTRSTGSAESIKSYNDINGISWFKNGLWNPIYTGYHAPYDIKPKKRSVGIGMALSYHPNFSVISCRTIFDTRRNGVFSSNVNQRKEIEFHQEKLPVKFPIRSFGICLQSIPGKRKNSFRTILEISRPKIRFADSEEELRKLPQVELSEYPYVKYGNFIGNIKKEKNPDALYAYAMQLLEGRDLVRGVDLLKEAANKYDHILAMYQLGICYWRGIGINSNMKEAFRYLKRAMEFDLPEARAMFGLLKLRSSSKPHSDQAIRHDVYNALNKAEKYNSRHPNWVMAVIFNNYESSLGGLCSYSCSPKLSFWYVRNQFIIDYYRGRVFETTRTSRLTAPVLPQPENDKKLKTVTTTVPDGLSLEKPHRSNEFIDIRLKHVTPVWQSPVNVCKNLDEIIQGSFSPAMYYKGQLLAAGFPVWNGDRLQRLQPDYKKALAIFEYGAKAGNLECAIEALHCKARLGELKPNDFTPASDIKFANHPLYYMLKYMVNQPNTPGIKEFLNQQYVAAREIWSKQSSPWCNFLLGAEAVYQYWHYGFDTALYRLYYDDTKDLVEAYNNLDRAAAQDIEPALYLVGMYYLTGQRSNSLVSERTNREKALRFLEKAALRGHLMAQYHIIKYNFENNRSVDSKWLKQLKPMRDANSPDAWLLSSDILAKQASSSQRSKIVEAYEQTASRGNYRAWNRLGWLYYNNSKTNSGDKARAAECWKKFIIFDRQARKQDPLDPYWDNITPPKLWYYDKIGLPSPCSSLMKLDNETIKFYLETY